jgi:Ni/Fe-hydrogenase subunit HybB-like protein
MAFLWRLALTTATGSIFGFLVARVGYNSALMAPMFIIMSFAYGLAVFHAGADGDVQMEQHDAG